jgi:flavorubredoxin
MCTYVPEDKILFSCDFFGTHLATSHLFADEKGTVYESAKRYYAEIMMPFRKQIIKNLAKLDPLDIEMIAPSHGPVHHEPEFIVDAYKDWTSDTPKNDVVVTYVSMHGSTGKLVMHLVDALIERGIEVKQFDLASMDVGKLAIALVDVATVVIGSPTVLIGPHPCAAYAAFLANSLRPKAKFASIIGSYGWGSKMVEQLTGMLTNLKVEMFEPVITKGDPKDTDFAAIDKLADDILAKHKAVGLIQ